MTYAKIAHRLHDLPLSQVRIEVSMLSPSDADKVLYTYRDEYPHRWHDGIFYILRDRAFERRTGIRNNG